jgi:hypothetical protein
MSAPLSASPAWPLSDPLPPSLVKFDALWCSEDSRVRVATVGRQFFTSVDGDNFSGPHKSMDAARSYGAAIAAATGGAS